jgi:hypothetical protein
VCAEPGREPRRIADVARERLAENDRRNDLVLDLFGVALGEVLACSSEGVASGELWIVGVSAFCDTVALVIADPGESRRPGRPGNTDDIGL